VAVEILMPKLGQIMVEGIVNKWHKQAGDPVSQGEVIAEIETEKLNYDLEATTGGIFHPVSSEGAVVAVDAVMAYLLEDGESPPEAPASPAPAARITARGPVAAAPPRAPSGAGVPSSPGARKLAAKLGVDISQVTATGPRGRVVEDDVRKHAEATDPDPATPAGMPDASDRVQMGGVRKSIAEHMKRSLADTAQLTFTLEMDVTQAQRLRREKSSGADETLTTAHVFMKACAEAAKRHPELNTVLSGGTIHYFDTVNIGLAVALDEGLIVPVVRHVEQKSLAEVASETQELVERSREGKLSPDDLAGGTFTISVLGSVDSFTPILNASQSAILGIGRSVEKPVVRKGEVVVREMTTVSLTVDHQVIDGAVAAGFLRRLQRLVEQPAPLFK